jgi:putative endonuclease
MEKTQKRKTGDLGEDIAAKYLINKGFLILDRNYLKPWGEIDLVAKQGNKLHFVEVKTVSREAGHRSGGVRPEENMHQRKILRLHRAIQTYMLEKKVPESVDWQIDLACVYLDFSSRRARVELLENITL